ncbi:hypothetical protein BU16DRAFT_531433 [Lophium mytilinum]|uniref:Uncharacterized protein n=1 Tax=Lophium mytilinum TaxID=390894 RepID=A0A6A6QCD4_9PEZI|nr:hypothetical protein BU16DRAFT_531433 [Lophium mytilinum]
MSWRREVSCCTYISTEDASFVAPYCIADTTVALLSMASYLRKQKKLRASVLYYPSNAGNPLLLLFVTAGQFQTEE